MGNEVILADMSRNYSVFHATTFSGNHNFLNVKFSALRYLKNPSFLLIMNDKYDVCERGLKSGAPLVNRF